MVAAAGRRDIYIPNEQGFVLVIIDGDCDLLQVENFVVNEKGHSPAFVVSSSVLPDEGVVGEWFHFGFVGELSFLNYCQIDLLLLEVAEQLLLLPGQAVDVDLENVEISSGCFWPCP